MALEPEDARPRRPFESTADPDLFFDSASCAATLGRLRAAMVRGEPLSVLTGEAGTGKTELLHRLMGQLEGGGLRSVLFGLPVSLEDLRARLPAAEPGSRVAVGLDEAQALADSLLGALPALLADRPDIGILLVGQRELETKLAALEAGGAGLRVAVRCRLAPLASGEVGQYIHHRWRQAGSGPSPFTASAVKRIAEISGGIPQTINLLCSRALWLAQARGQDEIGAEMVDEAARDLMSATSRPAVRRSTLAAAVALPLVIAGAIVLWHSSPPGRDRPVESPQVEQPTAAPVIVATPSPEPARTESVPAVEPAPTGKKVARLAPAATPQVSEHAPRAPAKREPPPVAPTSPRKDEALLRGAESGDVGAVRAMLGEGASPNARDAGGFTPLMLAVIHDQPAIVDLLIARGAAVNAKNRVGLTPLMLAAINDNTGAVRALIARGVDMNARTKSGWTALTYAAWRGYPDVVRLLLTSGADPTVIDREGWSILQYVSWRAAEPASGGDPAGNPAAEAPTSPATRGAHTEVMTLLRQAGVKR